MKQILSCTSFLLAILLFLSAGHCKDSEEETDTFAGLAALGSWADNGDGTITDSATGLSWTKCAVGQAYNADFANCQAAGSGTVFGAKSFTYCDSAELCTDGATLTADDTSPASIACTSLNYNGITGWRLPDQYEFGQVVSSFDYDSIEFIFPDNPDDKPFWTSSQKEDNTANAYAVRMTNSDFGKVFERTKTSVGYVRCVR